MPVVDLKFEKRFASRYAPGKNQKVVADAFRETGFQPGHGLPSPTHVSRLRPTLPRPPQS